MWTANNQKILFAHEGFNNYKTYHIGIYRAKNFPYVEYVAIKRRKCVVPDTNIFLKTTYLNGNIMVFT